MSNIPYVSDAILRKSAVVPDADDAEVWELLAKAVSRMFDRECEVTDGFFSPADEDASERVFEGQGTRYVRIGPYISSTIEAIDIAGEEYYETLSADRTYQEKDGFLVFDAYLPEYTTIAITARWGFDAVPDDVQLACIEQALFMWRKKDLAFADLSGVPTVAVTAEFSPTFAATVRRYRDLYGSNMFFT